MELDRNLIEKHHAGLVDDDGNILWNTIDYTQKAWLEFTHDGQAVYLEKEDGFHLLALGDSISDLLEEYGTRHFPDEAISDGRALIFDDYSSLEKYVADTYSIKSLRELEEQEKMKYLAEFLHYATDGVISSSERASLVAFGESIGLSRSEMTDIEDDCSFSVREDGRNNGVDVTMLRRRRAQVPKHERKDPDMDMSR